MFAFNSHHADLVLYMFALCCFILVWVFVILAWQASVGDVVGSLPNESNTVELVWTIIPTSLVWVLCYLNLSCLVSDTCFLASDVVKIVGRQWYWSYDLEGGSNVYDSLMLDFIDSVDKPLRLFAYTPYNLLVTSADVIHSFALPAFNIKIDAIPGRLNQLFLCPPRVGVFVGYCSELCGAGHAYMPIVVEVVDKGFCKLD